MHRFATALAAAALVIAVAPAPAQQTRSISASDKATGAKANPELLEQYGGAYAGPAADYVARVGRRIAVQSGLSNSQGDFQITLLNSPINNAFAIPGGYVYVTRQLVALMNDEAELASVLGHEVGHVAARHANKRNTTSTIGQILSAGVGVLTGNSGLGQLAGYGAQMYTLRFSRSQEYQADDLGIRYLVSAGYDPYAASDMLASLNAQSTLDARLAGKPEEGAAPAWTSTHPNTTDRVRRARDRAAATGAEPGRATRNRDAFLAAIDGMLYDDDPAQGIVDGQTFRHPVLKLQFTAPPGYAIANGTSAVTISGDGGQAQFAGGGTTGDLTAYVQQVFRSAGAQNGVDAAAIRPTRINGMDAARALVRANASRGQVDVGVTAFRSASGVFHFLTITPAGSGVGLFEGMIGSVSPLSASAAAAIRPRRVRVVTVGAGDTIATLSARMAYDTARQERFLVLNALQAGEALRPGDKVKLIVR